MPGKGSGAFSNWKGQGKGKGKGKAKGNGKAKGKGKGERKRSQTNGTPIVCRDPYSNHFIELIEQEVQLPPLPACCSDRVHFLQEKVEKAACEASWALDVRALCRSGACITNLFLRQCGQSRTFGELFLPSKNYSRPLPKNHEFAKGDLVRLQSLEQAHTYMVEVQGVTTSCVRVVFENNDLEQARSHRGEMWRVDCGYSNITYKVMTNALQQVPEFVIANPSSPVAHVIGKHEVYCADGNQSLQRMRQMGLNGMANSYNVVRSVPDQILLNKTQRDTVLEAINSPVSLVQGIAHV